MIPFDKVPSDLRPEPECVDVRTGSQPPTIVAVPVPVDLPGAVGR